MARCELNPYLAHQFLKSIYGPYYSQAKGRSYLEVRGRKETDLSGKMPFNRFYLGIDSLLKGMGQWEMDRNYWIGVALRKSNKNGKKVDCLALPALYSDVDYGQAGHRKKSKWRTKEQALAAIQAFPLRPSILVHSGGGFQPYWLLKEPFSLENGNYAQVEAIMKGLTLALGGDVGTQDISRILRLPGTYNMKLAGTPRPVEISWSEPERVYSLSDFAQYETRRRTAQDDQKKGGSTGPQITDLEALNIPAWAKTLILTGVKEGYPSRSERDHAVIGELLRAGCNLDTIEAIFQTCLVGDKYLEKGCQGRAYLQASISKINGQGAGYAPADNKPDQEPVSAVWPEMATEAFYGLAGEFARLVEPHTESDPAALLLQFHIGFGNLIGKGAYAKVEADTHCCNLFGVAVGETAKGRKGTSWGQVKAPLTTVEPDWKSRVKSGLSSGEGLIFQVRDPIMKREAKKQKGQTVYEDVIVDPGEDDKRLLVVESEFANVLRQIERQGNILSSVARDAWDTGDLGTLTKNSPTKATGAHVSIIGHITKDELKRYLTRTEAGNGFGNRILWFCVKRSKALPEGGRIHEVDFAPFLKRLREAVLFAQCAGEVTRDSEARSLWAKVYRDLSDGKPGLVGALTSRAEAQVLRLSVIYALLDREKFVRVPHLLAALGVWDYCETSVRYIFGQAIGDPVADTILEALKATPSGLSRTEIYNLFGRHQRSENIQQSIGELLRQGFITIETIETGGRPTEKLKYQDAQKA